jgi:hypothetical protein
MAEFAWITGVEAEVATFEEWDPAGREYDAVVAGTAASVTVIRQNISASASSSSVADSQPPKYLLIPGRLAPSTCDIPLRRLPQLGGAGSP